ncbi:hypothetical protein [Halomarina ordinaria]|uniref:DUF8134 domain-containing protein n=1 Tax=Halomarina ordinaria TaxID=3033939 RepID=A0ABD5UFL0_9EURY|nr:hypothetical protein [Halomarina sp. PSRA2]
MANAVYLLDDGAWVSVNDRRELSVGQLWRLADHDFCDCSLADVLAEGFVDVGLVPPEVEVRLAGQCIACGAQNVTGWLRVGRVDAETGAFRGGVPESVHRPRSRR